jgi:hypothetical protein
MQMQNSNGIAKKAHDGKKGQRRPKFQLSIDLRAVDFSISTHNLNIFVTMHEAYSNYLPTSILDCICPQNVHKHFKYIEGHINKLILTYLQQPILQPFACLPS